VNYKEFHLKPSSFVEMSQLKAQQTHFGFCPAHCEQLCGRKSQKKWSISAGIVAITDRNRVKNGRPISSILSQNTRPIVVISTLFESLVHDESNDIQFDPFPLKNNPAHASLGLQRPKLANCSNNQSGAAHNCGRFHLRPTTGQSKQTKRRAHQL
jgi:hypothetical protein